MKRIGYSFRAVIALLLSIMISLSVLPSVAVADDAEDYIPGWQSAGYAYADQIYFDSLDTRELNKIEFNKFNALADETYYWDLNGRDPEKCRKEYEQVANAIIAKVDPSWSDFRKLAYLHDYICETTEYDRYGTDKIRYSAYGCLVLHKCVCDGYARAFYDLANRLGFETYYVMSQQGDHAWNITKLNGSFYYVDCTMDSHHMNNKTCHYYFLKSESYMANSMPSLYGNADICIPGYATVGSDSDISIYNKYNNTTYDNAPFNNILGPIGFTGNGDEYLCVYFDNSKSRNILKIADTNSLSSTIEIKYDTRGDFKIVEFYARGNTVIVILNCGNGYTIGYGTVVGNSVEINDLIRADNNESYLYMLDHMIVKGNVLSYQKNTYLIGKDENVRETIEIDVSDVFESQPDPFELNIGDLTSGITDTSGSPAVIEGLNLQWNTVNGKSYWYENGVKQGTYDDAHGILGDGTIRGREIYDPTTGGWYWLDSCYFGAKAVNKEVWMPYVYQNENPDDDDQLMNLANICDGGWDGMGRVCYEAMKSGTGKWVRYNEEGKMLKGWITIEGALAQLYPKQTGNRYYYDSVTGLMAKGNVTIDGVSYYFDETTGVLRN